MIHIYDFIMIEGGKLRVTSSIPRVTSSNPRVTSSMRELRVQVHDLQD